MSFSVDISLSVDISNIVEEHLRRHVIFVDISNIVDISFFVDISFSVDISNIVDISFSAVDM